MSLFHSENPKEEQHSGILGAFSVDNIKWEPGDEAGLSRCLPLPVRGLS